MGENKEPEKNNGVVSNIRDAIMHIHKELERWGKDKNIFNPPFFLKNPDYSDNLNGSLSLGGWVLVGWWHHIYCQNDGKTYLNGGVY